MDNFMALGKVAEEYQKMTEEMNKRLLNGISEEAIKEYDEKAATSSREELEKAYPEIYSIVMKKMKVGNAILTKDVEIELTEVDKTEFVKGVTKGTPTITAGVFENFEIMFKQEEKEEDFSELDELMKD